MGPPESAMASRSCAFCRKTPVFTPRSVSGWMRSKHFSLSSLQLCLSPDPLQTPTGMRGWFNLHGLACLGSSANWHWQLSLAIFYSSFRGFLPIHGPSQENPIPRIQILVNHREEEAHRDIPKGTGHAAHSSWEKLRGGCSVFQLRDAQAERSF